MQALNEKQKTGLWLGIALAVGMGLYPPWQLGAGGPPGKYAPIFDPPPSIAGQPPVQIDFSRLILEWAMVGLVAGGMILSGKEAEATPGRSGSRTPPAAVALDMEPPTPMHTMRFPEKRAIGELLLENADDPEYWDFLAVAKGLVAVPEESRLQLELDKENHVDLSCLVRAEMLLIVSIDASDSKIKDEDLLSIAALRNLQDLDLSNTSITNEGVQKLVSLRSLQRIWLDGTKVTDEVLGTLKELPNLLKVSFANTEVEDSRIISLRDERSGQCEFVLRNGSSA